MTARAGASGPRSETYKDHQAKAEGSCVAPLSLTKPREQGGEQQDKVFLRVC